MKVYGKRYRDKKRAAFDASPVVDGTIRCSTCKEEKHVSEFVPSVVAVGCGQCRACKYLAKRGYEKRNPERVNAAARKRRQALDGEVVREKARDYYRNNPEKYRAYNLARYGITPAEYDRLLASQGGVCACCGAAANRDGKRLFVDHDHETGTIRGIICINCNRGIAAMGDDIEGVKRALEYLKRAQWVRVHAPRMRVNLLEKRN